ncbi:MAG: hypothetical protein IBX45_12430 [Campylobacterales bacterium]|nr:hypothetical protein [Campylobacterales bacterium]
MEHKNVNKQYINLTEEKTMVVTEKTLGSLVKTKQRVGKIQKAKNALTLLQDEIESENPHIEMLKRLGFDTIFYGLHDEPVFAFINYNKDRIDDVYYKIIFDPKAGEFKKCRDDVRDIDVENIRKVLTTEIKD